MLQWKKTASEGLWSLHDARWCKKMRLFFIVIKHYLGWKMVSILIHCYKPTNSAVLVPRGNYLQLTFTLGCLVPEGDFRRLTVHLFLVLPPFLSLGSSTEFLGVAYSCEPGFENLSAWITSQGNPDIIVLCVVWPSIFLVKYTVEMGQCQHGKENLFFFAQWHIAFVDITFLSNIIALDL